MTTPNPSPDDIVIVGAARTAQGKMLGALASRSAVELGAAAITGALEKAGVSAETVDYVYMGQVVQAAAGQNPAKQAAVTAGLPVSTPAVTVNKVCLSGLDAVINGARMIRVGDAQVVVAGGQESMTNAPHLAAGVRAGAKFGSLALQDSLERDGLTDPVHGIAMGVETEQGNVDRGITREQQDEVAALSNQRAEAAINDGTFAEEIVPVEVKKRRETVVVDTDEDQGLPVLAALGASGETAGPDTYLHSQPAQAVSAALDKQGWGTDDLDFLEVNEAFAAVVVQSVKDLDYPLQKTNIHGGGISLGHPIGASGARLVVTAAHELNRRGGGRAAVSLCGGGGQGDALLLWR